MCAKYVITKFSRPSAFAVFSEGRFILDRGRMTARQRRLKAEDSKHLTPGRKSRKVKIRQGTLLQRMMATKAHSHGLGIEGWIRWDIRQVRTVR